MNRFHYDPDHDYTDDPFQEKQGRIHKPKEEMATLRHEHHERRAADRLFHRCKAKNRKMGKTIDSIRSQQHRPNGRLCNVKS